MAKEQKLVKKAALNRLVLRMSAKFNYVLFPLDLRELVNRLASLHYLPIGDLPPEPSAVGPDATLGGQGPVARKADLMLDVNSEKQFLGVAGPREAKETLSELFQVLDVVSDTLESSKIAFYEMQARYRARPPSSPLAAIARLGKDSKLARETTEALGLPVDLFSARLISGPSGPNHTDYLEVWLQPATSLPTKDLGLSVIFRDADRRKFEATSQQLEGRLQRLLDSAFRQTKS